MNGYDVIPYGHRWAVRTPSGSIRCVVDDQEFAESIAHDCANDVTSSHMPNLPKPVICVETGQIYEDTAAVGLKRRGNIAKACRCGTQAGGCHWDWVRKELGI